VSRETAVQDNHNLAQAERSQTEAIPRDCESKIDMTKGQVDQLRAKADASLKDEQTAEAKIAAAVAIIAADDK